MQSIWRTNRQESCLDIYYLIIDSKSQEPKKTVAVVRGILMTDEEIKTVELNCRMMKSIDTSGNQRLGLKPLTF